MDDLVKYLVTPLLSENTIEELAKQLGKLYHFTGFKEIDQILTNNTFIGSVAKVDKEDLDFKAFRLDIEKLKGKNVNFVHFFSTTRDKLLYIKDPKIKGSTVRIVLDGDKLSNKYKILPYYYYHDEMIDEPNPKYEQDESEERVILPSRSIPDAKNYIKEIHVILDKIEDNQDYILKIKQLINKYPDIKCFYKEKPITIEQYESMFSQKQPVTENLSPSNMNFKTALASLTKYMLNSGMNITPLPKLKIINTDLENASNILGKTAHYNPTDCSITLFTLNRHPKDILRSYAHEMIHRIQDNEGRLNNINTTNTNEDGYLEDLEKEAYLNGNITFRHWEDDIKNNPIIILSLSEIEDEPTFGSTRKQNEYTLTSDDASKIYDILTNYNSKNFKGVGFTRNKNLDDFYIKVFGDKISNPKFENVNRNIYRENGPKLYNAIQSLDNRGFKGFIGKIKGGEYFNGKLPRDEKGERIKLDFFFPIETPVNQELVNDYFAKENPKSLESDIIAKLTSPTTVTFPVGQVKDVETILANAGISKESYKLDKTEIE